MIDLQMLRIAKYKDDFWKLRGRIPLSAMNKETVAMLTDFEAYFKRFQDHDVIDMQTFYPLWCSLHPNYDEATRAAYEKLMGMIKQDVAEADKEQILHSLMELRLGTELGNLALRFEAGEIANIAAELNDVFENFKRDAKVKGIDFDRTPIGDLLQADIHDNGLKWRIRAMNEATRGLRDGDFGIAAGRPDKGKTTFVCSEVAFMAPQLEKGRPVVWLNNEGPGFKIRQRMYQSALGLTVSEMIDMHSKGNLEKAYQDYMQDDWKIRVFDVHGMDTYAVENIIDSNNAGMVIYDMIDNVRGFADSSRTDQALEKMYQWGRELCVKYENIGIATSQISSEGDGLQFPTLGMLKESKTGKQGACDWQLMIGATNDPNMQSVRHLGMPKNKIRREGFSGDPRVTVAYNPERARYEDLEIVDE